MWGRCAWHDRVHSRATPLPELVYPRIVHSFFVSRFWEGGWGGEERESTGQITIRALAPGGVCQYYAGVALRRRAVGPVRAGGRWWGDEGGGAAEGGRAPFNDSAPLGGGVGRVPPAPPTPPWTPRIKLGQITSKGVVRSTAGAYAIPPFLGVIRLRYLKVWYRMSNPL